MLLPSPFAIRKSQPAQSQITSTKIEEHPNDNHMFSNSLSKGRFFAMPEDHLILQRTLGHCEIPGKYKWKMSNYCHLCEKW